MSVYEYLTIKDELANSMKDEELDIISKWIYLTNTLNQEFSPLYDDMHFYIIV